MQMTSQHQDFVKTLLLEWVLMTTFVRAAGGVCTEDFI